MYVIKVLLKWLDFCKIGYTLQWIKSVIFSYICLKIQFVYFVLYCFQALEKILLKRCFACKYYECFVEGWCPQSLDAHRGTDCI